MSTVASVVEPVAIVGIGCRFPGAPNPEALWQLLIQGKDAIREVPADRWSIRAFYDPDSRKPGKLSAFRGGFLNQIDRFDAAFFGISPREAAYLDPQQRLLLEVAWEALEDGGQVAQQLAGTDVGVFIGAFTLDYMLLQLGKVGRPLIDTHTATGSMMTMISNRLSYLFDFRGPSISVDTACSSSLVAVHLACQSLRNSECSLALAGGVNVMSMPDYTIAESKGGFLSPDGASKAFSARANGYARGEGAGIAVLKLLSRAVADGDPIYAVIRGSAVNQDGHTNGITVPRGEAQQSLVREACRRANVSPGLIQYVEAHGTGTPVGDPIEADALGRALSEERVQDGQCLIGSIKTNIGHLEAAAGIAGLIKTTLCMKHRQIPPTLYTEDPNPKIPFADLRLRIPGQLEKWPATSDPILAGVNSFGFGGTNAHVVLGDAPQASPVAGDKGDVDTRRMRLLPISARSSEALYTLAENWRECVKSADSRVDDLCYTAGVRRGHHDYRLAVAGRSREEFAAQLEAYLAGETRRGMASGRAGHASPSKLVFVFTGMGPQWWAMGRELYNQQPTFRAAVDEVAAMFQTETGWPLLAELLAEEGQSRMVATQVSQTANFALQVGLAKLWESWGIYPDAVVGHSVGEVSSSYLSGALSLRDAVRVSYHRSRLQQRTAGKGGMMAVGLSAEEAADLVRPYESRVSIAAVNSHSSTTLAGDQDALQEIAGALEARKVFCRPLRVEVAYHSHHMDPIRDELLDSLRDLRPKTAARPLYSTVTAGLVSGIEVDAEYWWKNVRNPVRFAAAVDELIRDDHSLFLEVGPHPVLAGSITECLAKSRREGRTICSLRRGEDEQATILGALGELYCAGYPVDWKYLHPAGGRVVALPSYPWQREHYWTESRESEEDRLGYEVHPLLGKRLQTARAAWELDLNKHNLTWLEDHRIRGAVICPGAAYIEAALAAAAETFGSGNYAVENIRFRKALFLLDGEDPKVQFHLNAAGPSFEIHGRSRVDASWVLHCSGDLRQSQDTALPPGMALQNLRDDCAVEISKEVCYARLAEKGFEYGSHFQGIARLWRGSGTALARIVVPDAVNGAADGYHLHPVILDACFQTLIAADVMGNDDGTNTAYLPIGIDRIRLHDQPTGNLWAYAQVKHQGSRTMAGDIVLMNGDDQVLAEIRGVRVQSVEARPNLVSQEPIDRSIYEIQWSPSDGGSQVEAAWDRPGSWLILADSQGVAKGLAASLESSGETCLMASPDETSEPENLRRLIGQAFGPDRPACRGIVHLWSIDMPSFEQAGGGALDRAERFGCLTLKNVVQALGESGKSPRIWIVTRGAQRVVAKDRSIAVTQAPLWGMGRVIGHQEHAGLWGGLIDLDPDASADDVGMILNEVRGRHGEDQVAFRDGNRFVPQLVRSRSLVASLPVKLRPEASYLITGGLGALGLLTADWMVERGARRLILMGRTAMPPRSLWKDVDPESALGERVKDIREIEAKGASVYLAQVDSADEEQLTTFLRRYEDEGWPPIMGVVHAAGTVRDQLLVNMDDESFRSVLRPKVQGAALLHRLFANAPLDFFVLYSSTGSVVASAGQANYAAGNAFMDSLAQYRRARQLPALSINWGPWALGMVKELNLVEHYARRGIESITAERGCQFLDRLFGQNLAQALVVTANWKDLFQYQPRIPHMLESLKSEETESAENSLSSEQSEGVLERLLADPEGAQTILLAHLCELTARVLRLDAAKLDGDQSLSAFGMDSMMATELKNRIELSLHVSVSVMDLLKGASLAELAGPLLAQLAEQVEAMARDLPLAG
jgi:acyl transferase domain-containing protein